MLLRSASTPVLGSLLPSVSDSPSNNYAHFHETASSTFLKHGSLNKLPYHHYQTGCLHLTGVSCSSSPLSPSIADLSDRLVKGFRRAQSEGNLEGLSSAFHVASCNNNDEHYEMSHPKTVSGRSRCLMLETIPSFSHYSLKGQYEDEEDDEDEEEGGLDDVLDEEDQENLREAPAEGIHRFGISNKTGKMVLTEQARVVEGSRISGFQDERVLVDDVMYLAKGLGIDGSMGNGYGGGGSGGRDCGGSHFRGGDGEDMNQTEEYYKRMLQETPGNPLLLRNYAQFLYQSKGDLTRAEEYYSRAILADPQDGETLSQYAKLVWELYRDEDRASAYFERAAEASPEDSHVHASYASFLWETEEDEDECQVPHDINSIPPSFCQGPMASATA